jgi:hypothetical protein
MYNIGALAPEQAPDPEVGKGVERGRHPANNLTRPSHSTDAIAVTKILHHLNTIAPQ